VQKSAVFHTTYEIADEKTEWIISQPTTA